MTNFERIKNMSVEEMAETILSSCSYNCKKLDICDECSCDECMIEWLNSESEE